MDDIEKSKVRLSHWISHNIEHVTGYLEVAELLETQGRGEIAGRIKLGVEFVEKANKEFEQALSMLGGDLKSSEASHSHSHSHEHSHAHEHSHGDETHEHSHSLGHCGLHKHKPDHEHD